MMYFNRHELKFLATREQFNYLWGRLSYSCDIDQILSKDNVGYIYYKIGVNDPVTNRIIEQSFKISPAGSIWEVGGGTTKHLDNLSTQLMRGPTNDEGID